VLLAIFVAITSAQAIEGRGAISPDKTRREPPDFHKAMDFYETGRRIRVMRCRSKSKDDTLLRVLCGVMDETGAQRRLRDSRMS